MTSGPRHRKPRPGWWLPALLIMAAIWWLSSQSETLGPDLRHPFDWIAHFLAYLALAFSLGRATASRASAFLIAVWFGAFDEVHQAFVPGRDAGITDWLFDLLGAWTGVRLAVRGKAVQRKPEDRAPVADLSEVTR